MKSKNILHLLGMGATLIITAFVAFGHEPDHTNAEVLMIDSGLLINTRDKLHVCANTSSSVTQSNFKVNEKLTNIIAKKVHPNKNWIPAGLGKDIPNIESDCLGVVDVNKIVKSSLNNHVPIVTKSPSMIRTVLIVISDAEAKSILGSKKATTLPLELLKINEHQAGEVTTGLIISESMLDNIDEVQSELLLAFGIDPENKILSPASEFAKKK